LMPALLHLVGVRASFLITGALLPIVTIPLWHRLRRLDAPTIALRRSELLRGDPIFAPLPEAVIQQLATSLEPVSLDAGQVLFHQGDAGDRYYLVDTGSLQIEPSGKPAVELGPGSGFGEIALMRDVPRTATARAGTNVSLYAMRGDEFVSAVTGHATSAAAADAVIAGRLLALRPALASL
jgi:CRP-like cAMP-binding protein